MQPFCSHTLFPRPGGGTIAAGNRDRSRKKVEKQRVCLVKPGWARGARGHTNQQDRIQSIRGKTKIISLGEILKGEVLKGEVLKDKPQQKLTRPGRLRARSGSKLPKARFRSGPKDGGVRRSGSLVLSSGALLKVFQKQK